MALPVTSGLQLWFDASQITGVSDGSSLTTWLDESGLSNNAVITGTAVYHTNQINTLPAVSFGGGSNYGTLNSPIAAAAGNTIFVVIKNASTANKGTLIGGPNGAFAYWTCGSGAQQGVDRQQQVQMGTGATVPSTTWHQQNAVQTASSLAFEIDGGVDPIEALNPSATTATTAVICTNGGSLGAESFNGLLAELIYYNRNLSSTEIGSIESYLHTKYFVSGPPPVSIVISPTSAAQGTTATITVTGTNTHFAGGTTTVGISGTGVTVGTITVASTTSLTVVLTISSGATAGARTLTVTTGSEAPTASLTITAAALAQRGNIDYDQVQRAVRQGPGSKFQMFGGGSVTTGHVAVYDSSGNVVDSGSVLPSGGTPSPLTTKGDLYSYDTTNNRLPVGSNGQILTVDSSQTLGIKWATPTSSSGLAGNWIKLNGIGISDDPIVTVNAEPWFSVNGNSWAQG